MNLADYLNRWIHFQVYIKMATTNSGIVKAWVYNKLIGEITNVRTDPSMHSAARFIDLVDTKWNKKANVDFAAITCCQEISV